MEVKGLDLLLLEVNSLEESLRFYHEQLGLEIVTHMPDSEPPMATLGAGRTRITLVEQLETMLRRGRGCHFFLSVMDVEAYYKLLLTRGLDLKPPVDEGWGGRFVTLEDPDKYRLFFVTWDEGV
jgi:catechol 2,3-dioxygenase-like lactoylglutathione lyase family enzyme